MTGLTLVSRARCAASASSSAAISCRRVRISRSLDSRRDDSACRAAQRGPRLGQADFGLVQLGLRQLELSPGGRALVEEEADVLQVGGLEVDHLCLPAVRWSEAP